MSATTGIPASITTPGTVQTRLGTVEQNADGSTDLYFGPQAPAGKLHNWIQTLPGKGWFGILRLYSPLQPFFDKSWPPSEIEAYSTGSNGHDPQTRR